MTTNVSNSIAALQPHPTQKIDNRSINWRRRVYAKYFLAEIRPKKNQKKTKWSTRSPRNSVRTLGSKPTIGAAAVSATISAGGWGIERSSESRRGDRGGGGGDRAVAGAQQRTSCGGAGLARIEATERRPIGGRANGRAERAWRPLRLAPPTANRRRWRPSIGRRSPVLSRRSRVHACASVGEGRVAGRRLFEIASGERGQGCSQPLL